MLNRLKPFIFPFILTLIFVIILTRVNNNYRSQIEKLTDENLQCKETQETVQLTPSEVNLNDLVVYKEKTQTDLSTPATNVYFTAKISGQSADTATVDFYLEGNSNSSLYTADLYLNFDQNLLTVLDVTAGESFPIYPRSVYGLNTAVITGVSQISGSQITFGKPSTLFASVKIGRKSKVKQQYNLNVDVNQTHVFYQTQDILDKTKSVNRITL